MTSGLGSRAVSMVLILAFAVLALPVDAFKLDQKSFDGVAAANKKFGISEDSNMQDHIKELGVSCIMCHMVLATLEEYKREKKTADLTAKEAKKKVKKICAERAKVVHQHLPDKTEEEGKELCTGYVKALVPDFWKLLTSGSDPAGVCADVRACKPEFDSTFRSQAKAAMRQQADMMVDTVTKIEDKIEKVAGSKAFKDLPEKYKKKLKEQMLSVDGMKKIKESRDKIEEGIDMSRDDVKKVVEKGIKDQVSKVETQIGGAVKNVGEEIKKETDEKYSKVEEGLKENKYLKEKGIDLETKFDEADPMKYLNTLRENMKKLGMGEPGDSPMAKQMAKMNKIMDELDKKTRPAPAPRPYSRHEEDDDDDDSDPELDEMDEEDVDLDDQDKLSSRAKANRAGEDL